MLDDYFWRNEFKTLENSVYPEIMQPLSAQHPDLPIEYPRTNERNI